MSPGNQNSTIKIEKAEELYELFVNRPLLENKTNQLVYLLNLKKAPENLLPPCWNRTNSLHRSMRYHQAIVRDKQISRKTFFLFRLSFFVSYF